MTEKTKKVYELAEIGYPPDIIAKLVTGLELTQEEQERSARAIAEHLQDRNVSTARHLGIL